MSKYCGNHVGSISAVFSSPVFDLRSSGVSARSIPEQRLVLEPRNHAACIKKRKEQIASSKINKTRYMTMTAQSRKEIRLTTFIQLRGENKFTRKQHFELLSNKESLLISYMLGLVRKKNSCIRILVRKKNTINRHFPTP